MKIGADRTLHSTFTEKLLICLTFGVAYYLVASFLFDSLDALATLISGTAVMVGNVVLQYLWQRLGTQYRIRQKL
jgi:hypothetical protein